MADEEIDSQWRWYCWQCEQSWDFREKKQKVCPSCGRMGTRQQDMGAQNDA